ncbi:MAG: hypothetical protein KAJ19_28905 [Gammaproteobacteria bacterium]|nr:hypothetical protein [Gammaproteobacteria bacterium]
MATKKKGKKKTAAKKSAGKKSTRTKRAKKVKVPYEPNAERLSYFMGQLIQAGYVGKAIPKEGKGKKVASMEIRQMAQQLDRQVHRTVT